MFVTASNLSVSHLSLHLPFLLNLWAPRAVTERCHDLFTAETGRIWQEATAQTDLGLAYLCPLSTLEEQTDHLVRLVAPQFPHLCNRQGDHSGNQGRYPVCTLQFLAQRLPPGPSFTFVESEPARWSPRPPPLVLPLLGSPRCGARGLSRRHWCWGGRRACSASFPGGWCILFLPGEKH